MNKNFIRLPLYMGMAILTISILTVAFEVTSKNAVTQTQSNARKPNPTPQLFNSLTITPTKSPYQK